MKFLNKLMIPLLLFMGLSLNGCIFDNLETIPLNIPITVNINVSGSQDPVSESGFICLDDSDVYQDYQSKINEINLLEITFRAQNVNPSPLTGDVEITISEQGSGNTLLTQNLGTLTLTNSTVVTLNLTQAQLQLIDAYLNSQGECFTAEIMISNISPAGQRSLVATIDFVFQADSDI